MNSRTPLTGDEKMKLLHNTRIPRPNGLDDDSASAVALKKAKSEGKIGSSGDRSHNYEVGTSSLNELNRASDLFGIDLSHLSKERSYDILNGKYYGVNPTGYERGITPEEALVRMNANDRESEEFAKAAKAYGEAEFKKSHDGSIPWYRFR